MKLENRIEIYNIPDRVICQICKNRFKSITESHLARHNLNMKEYKKMFPGVAVFCADSRRKLSSKTRRWIKKHPEHIPPSRLKEYRKDKTFMKKSQQNNALVQNLPYMKKRFSKQTKMKWNTPGYKKVVQKRRSQECEERIKKYMPLIIKLRQKGYYYRHIGNLIGFSKSTISNWVKKNEENRTVVG